MSASHEVTRLLLDWGNGKETSRDELLPLIFGDYARLAEYGWALEAIGGDGPFLLTRQSQPAEDTRVEECFFGSAGGRLSENVTRPKKVLRSSQRRLRDDEYSKERCRARAAPCIRCEYRRSRTFGKPVTAELRKQC